MRESWDIVLRWRSFFRCVMAMDPRAASLVAPTMGRPTLVYRDSGVLETIAWCIILESAISHIWVIDGQPTAASRTDVKARE